MPFGLGKSEKQPENEGAPIREEAIKDSNDPAAAASENGGGPSMTDSPTIDGEGEPGAPHEPKAVRPAFLGKAAPPQVSAATPSPPTPNGDVFFVSVTRQDAAETHRFDNPAEAQTFVETLLEQGASEEEVAAYSGRKLALKVSRRPIVKLTTAQED